MDHVEHMEFHSLHLLDTDISVDSTWTLAVLIIYFVGIGLLMKTMIYQKISKNKDILILNKLDFFMLFIM